MGQPTVPIDVDPDSGIWRTDGLPMVYLPRHFLVNNHLAVEEALGVEVYRGILRTATDKSAVHWCRSESRMHGLTAEQTFRHYFQRLSRRGWGQFHINELDLERRCCSMNLAHSVFALECRGPVAGPVCYMFEGFMTGGLRYLFGAGEDAEIVCAEMYCVAQGEHNSCRFEAALRLA